MINCKSLLKCWSITKQPPYFLGKKKKKRSSDYSTVRIIQFYASPFDRLYIPLLVSSQGLDNSIIWNLYTRSGTIKGWSSSISDFYPLVYFIQKQGHSSVLWTQSSSFLLFFFNWIIHFVHVKIYILIFKWSSSFQSWFFTVFFFL